MLRWLNLSTRKHQFINPVRIYWQHRRQMIEDFPASLPPEEDENILTTTMLLTTIKQSYTTQPIVTQLKKARIIVNSAGPLTHF